MSEAVPPPALAVDGAHRDRELIFYSLSTCAMCRKAREYLGEKGYAYRLIMVDQLDPDEKNRLKEELTRRHGARVVFPALQIDDSRIVLGFFRGAWDEALRESSSHG
jgi:glutaredoxin